MWNHATYPSTFLTYLYKLCLNFLAKVSSFAFLSVSCRKIRRLCKIFFFDKPLITFTQFGSSLPEVKAETFCRRCRVKEERGGSASSRLNCVGRLERGRQYNLGQNRRQKRRVVQPMRIITCWWVVRLLTLYGMGIEVSIGKKAAWLAPLGQAF